MIAGLIAVVFGIINYRFAAAKQRREDKIARAKFGYELIDKLLTNEFALKFLESIDTSFDIEKIRKALDRSNSTDDPDDKSKLARNGFDWLLLHFDRMEHAIQAGLTEIEVIRMPLEYYVGILAKGKSEFLGYINHLKYDRVVSFLDRFKPWNELKD